MSRTLIRASRLVLAVISFAALNLKAGAAENDQAAWALLQERIQALITSEWTSNKSNEIQALWKSMEISSQNLRRRSADYRLSPLYVQSLNSNSEALGMVVSRAVPEQKKLELCRSVDKDLKAKVEFARDPKGQNPFGDFEVIVHTLTGKDETKGCEVWYALEAWRDVQGRYQRFEKVSSPTASRLVAGYYIFWSQRDGKPGAPTPVEIKAAKPIHIPAPPPSS